MHRREVGPGERRLRRLAGAQLEADEIGIGRRDPAETARAVAQDLDEEIRRRAGRREAADDRVVRRLPGRARGGGGAARNDADLEDVAAAPRRDPRRVGGAVDQPRGLARRAPTRGMVEQELVATYSYTATGYVPLNRGLRSGDPTQIAAVAAFRDTLAGALAKLPDRPGMTRRGTSLPADVLARYQPGQVVTELGFTSTGKPFKGDVRFEIHGRRGKLVQQYSAHPSEDEVLFPPGTKFGVVKRHTVQVPGGGTETHIVLEEID